MNSPPLKETLPKTVSLILGVVVESRPGMTRWQSTVTRTHSVFLTDNGYDPSPRQLYQEGQCLRSFAGLAALVLHRKETSDYITNLTSQRPSVYVGLRPSSEGAMTWRPFFVSVAPYEAEGYMHGGEEQIDAVAMPDEVQLALGEFVEAHHRDVPFKKRQRAKYFDPDFTPFARPPGWKETDR